MVNLSLVFTFRSVEATSDRGKDHEFKKYVGCSTPLTWICFLDVGVV